jgi:hypothetical protein
VDPNSTHRSSLPGLVDGASDVEDRDEGLARVGSWLAAAGVALVVIAWLA